MKAAMDGRDLIGGPIVDGAANAATVIRHTVIVSVRNAMIADPL